MSEVKQIPNELSPGMVLAGRFRVEKLLGRGGMGAVYKAFDTALSRDVAVKVITEHRRLSQEISALAALQHPHIVGIYAVERDDTLDTPILILEFISGQNLADIVESKGALPTDACISVAKQALQALQEAHSKQIVHRDLKPHNMMLDASNQLKILDFGLARVLGISDQRLTQTGEIIGTAYYISPEQCLAGEITPRTDIYALGATLYFLATGAPPFDGETAMEICLKQTHDMPDLTRVPDAHIAGIIHKAMAKNPADRFQSAAEMAKAFDSAPLSIDASEPSRRPPQQRDKKRLILRAIPLAIACIATVYFVMQTSKPDKPEPDLSPAEVKKNLQRANLMADSGHSTIDQYKYLSIVEDNVDAIHLSAKDRETLEWTMSDIARQLNQPDGEILHRGRLITLLNKRADPHFWVFAAQLEGLLKTGRKEQAIKFAKTQLAAASKGSPKLVPSLTRASEWMLHHAYKEAGRDADAAALDQSMTSTPESVERDAELLKAVNFRLKSYPKDSIAYFAKYYLELPHSKQFPDLRAAAQQMWEDRETRVARGG